MTDLTRTIREANGKLHTVIIRRDRRLKKWARWNRQPDGSILLRVPFRMPVRHIDSLLEDIARSLGRRRRTPRTDAGLQARAEHLNNACFGGQITWASIRWVGNMDKRLGSCSHGGATDGDIRISERIREWPDWVVDYVIAHELAHRTHPDHSPAFWDYLKAAYPLTERARGFIQGISFARGETLEEDAG